jgi:hypothetical protein
MVIIRSGVLYLLFAAVPIVYEQQRGYNTLVGALPFIAVLLGSFTAAAINLTVSTSGCLAEVSLTRFGGNSFRPRCTRSAWTPARTYNQNSACILCV